MNQRGHDQDPLRPHYHDPNPEPPSADPGFILALPDGSEDIVTVPELAGLPQTILPACYIVSTGHGASGPFAFQGPTLLALITSRPDLDAAWSEVEVISADGFGNRVLAAELLEPDPSGPIILAIALDGRPLTRAQGLVRMIVPGEKEDALRQVKWVGQINIR